MSLSLIIASISFSVIIIIFILAMLRRNKITIKYSLIWLLLFALLLVATLIPNFLVWITHFLGFKAASNMVISSILAVLVIISIALTVIVSNQDKKIRLLIQEVSLLKGNKNEKNSKKR